LKELTLRANFEKANLEGSYFEGSYFEKAYFQGVNLIEANLKWTKLRVANLIEVYVLSTDQLPKVKALYGTKLDEELMVQN
jgi:uncharacterized protein YjbI with pentapeptide repeats